MEFYSIDKLRITQVDPPDRDKYWKVVFMVDGVKVVAMHEQLDRGFSIVEDFLNAPDYQQKLSEYKKSIGL